MERRKNDSWLENEAADLEKYLLPSETIAQWPYQEVVLWQLVLSNLILGNGPFTILF